MVPNSSSSASFDRAYSMTPVVESSPELRFAASSSPGGIRAPTEALVPSSSPAFSAAAATFPTWVEQFQATYRDIVLGEASLARTLDLALQRFGSQDVGRGLKSLIGALGQDLAATRPSTDASRLQSLLTDMYHLEVAATVLESCGELSDKLAGQGEKPLDSSKLMRDMVGLTGEKWVSESRFTKLAQDHGVQTPTGAIAFLNGTRGMLRDLPVQIYADADTRQNLMNALQGALDTAIDAEEE